MKGDMSKLAKEVDLKSADCNGLVGSSPTIATILALYPEFKTVYGPYTRQDGRRILIFYDGKKRTARQYAKVLLEVKIGRRLVGDETVDHEDKDFTNDDPNNLRVLPLKKNISLGVRKPVVYTICAGCGIEFALTKDQRNTRARTSLKFCSRICKCKVCK